jgi:hypothetical protein
MPLPTHDRFGLPTFTLLESDEDHERRVARVEAFVAQAYKTVVDHLGEERARQLFVGATKRPRGKHGKRKELSADRDWTLVKELDAEVGRCGEGDASAVARVSRRLFAEKGKELGASAAAIERQLRRLLAARTKRQAREARRWRQWRESYKATMGSYPAPTLLELAGQTTDTDKK